MTDQPTNRSTRWLWAAVLLVAAVALGLRYGTNVLDKGDVFDEDFNVLPIADLLVRGWSVETAIDFVETKGPAFVWVYALGAELIGSTLNDLRVISVLFFVGGMVPLGLIARACGLGGREQLLVAVFYLLLPHNAALGQLLMSEPSFIFGALWLMWAFLWGFGSSRETQRTVLGPIVFGVILAALLHHRIHAVAFAGAAALTALERDRLRSWPWWLACAAAGLSRVPLWVRWEGLVAPEYQSMHGLGLGPDGLTYLAAALVPFVVVFLWPALVDPGCRRWRRLVWWGAGIGVALILVAQPDLSETLPFPGGPDEVLRFNGRVTRSIHLLTGSAALRALLLAALAVVGAASMGGLAAVSWQRAPGDRVSVVVRLLFWTLVTGCGLYALTRAMTFDRYLTAWAILLPVVWVATLPRKLQAVQAVILFVFFAWNVWALLVRT